MLRVRCPTLCRIVARLVGSFTNVVVVVRGSGLLPRDSDELVLVDQRFSSSSAPLVFFPQGKNGEASDMNGDVLT